METNKSKLLAKPIIDVDNMSSLDTVESHTRDATALNMLDVENPELSGILVNNPTSVELEDITHM